MDQFHLGLHKPGPVLLKRHIRSSKYEPIVDEAELIHATPSYARVRMTNGRGATVSLRDVDQIGNRRECICTDLTESDHDLVSCDDTSYSGVRIPASEPKSPDFAVSEASDNTSSSVADDFVPPLPEPTVQRRSTRISRPPKRFTYDRNHIRLC